MSPYNAKNLQIPRFSSNLLIYNNLHITHAITRPPPIIRRYMPGPNLQVPAPN